MSIGGTAVGTKIVTSNRSATLPSALFVGRICGPVHIGVRSVWALPSEKRASTLEALSAVTRTGRFVVSRFDAGFGLSTSNFVFPFFRISTSNFVFH